MADFNIELVRERLRKAMKDRKIGARPLSVLAGLGETAVRDIREGHRDNPGIATLAALAKALEVPLDYLLGTDTVPSSVVEIWRAIPDDHKAQAARVLESFKRTA